MADQIRAIPDIALDMDPAIKSVLEAVKENLEIREGMRGSASSNLQDKAAVDTAVDTAVEAVKSGLVLQTKLVRNDTQTTYAAPNSGDGNAISELALTITPKRADSIIMLEWWIHNEIQNDTMWVVHRDSVILPDSYNSNLGNVRYSGLAVANYDANDSSTPYLARLFMFDTPGSKKEVTYEPAIRSSSGTARTLYLHRTVGSTGADNHECGVSWGRISELAA